MNPVKKRSERSNERLVSHTSLEAFHIGEASTRPLTAGSWVGDLESGSSVNCWQLDFCAHGSGTHTECAAHVVSTRLTVNDMNPARSIRPCFVVTAEPEPLGASGEQYPPGQPDDLVIRFV